ncbi:MAG: MFS transporter, partial [Achromobacter sp.]|nr:MFS transporter [Achromobacter sp.]
MASVAGNAMEWYDFFIYGTAAALVFGELFFPHGTDPLLGTMGAFAGFAVGFLARPLGGVIFGHIGDRYGRKKIMMWALLLFCVATFFNAFARNYHEFYILRMIAGIGMGAEGAIIAPYLAEFVSSKYRGRFTGALAGFFSFGFVLSALLGYFIVPLSDDGWRWIMIIASVPVVFLLWWRKSLFESPRWLEHTGQTAEADRICSAIEAEVQQKLGRPLPKPIATRQAASADAGPQ